MKRGMSLLVLAVVTALCCGALSIGAVQQGIITPPTGTIGLGPIMILAERSCPSIVWPPLGWKPICGSDRPWTVWAFLRWPNGTVQQWQLLSITSARAATQK